MRIIEIRVVVAKQTDGSADRLIFKNRIPGESECRRQFVDVGHIDCERSFDEQST